MSEQPTMKLPAEDGPTPDADAFLKKALGKQPAGLLLFLAFGHPNDQ